MSFRFRSRNKGLRLRPVNRIKHVIDAQGGLVIATVATTNLIESVASPVLANRAEVEVGATVNGIYLHVEVYATSASALSNVYMIVWKNQGGNTTVPVPDTVGANDDKRFVIHQEMVMMERQINGNPRTLFNGVIVLPRGYRRFGPNDKLDCSFIARGVTVDFCLQCHYKEFR